MRIALVGKIGSVIHWLEDCVAAMRGDGHDVIVAASRNPALSRTLEAALLSERLGAPRAAAIARRIARFAPDLILAVGAYEIPRGVLSRIAALPGRAPLYAWNGDVFGEDARETAALFDAVAYTDSGLVARHRGLAFAPPALFLPHAVNPHALRPTPWPRADRMVFIANPTPHRRELVEAVGEPLAIYGPAWTSGAGHEIHARRVRPAELLRLYAAHIAALNIRNELNVIAGLNQRSFVPYLFATPVATDRQPDLETCFDPGGEVFTYEGAEDLTDLYRRLRAEPAMAAAVGERGRSRVLAEHTYGSRVARLSSLA